VYLGWPCPAMSARLQQWKTKNTVYFTYRERKLFLKDIEGQGSAGTVLLLHGFPTMSYDWIKVLPVLKENFNRIVAVDFLGFGFSEKPLGYEYTIMEQADLMAAMMQTFRMKDVHLLSHDYGDSVAQELLARQNEGKSNYSIKSACLLNGGMFKETNFPRPIQNLAIYSPTLTNILVRFSNRFIFTRGLSDVFGNDTKPSEEDLDDFWYGYCRKQGYLNSGDILQYINERATHNIRWRAALQNSVIPVHVIYGPADPVNPRPFIDFYKKTVPKGTIDVLADHIGHYPQWEDSENVGKLYIKFVSGTWKA